MAKWLGFGILIPSNRYKIPAGVLPRTTISFLESSEPCTPAKFVAILAGSPLEPAYRLVSSTENLRAETNAISFFTSPLGAATTCTSSSLTVLSVMSTRMTACFAELSSTMVLLGS